MKKIIIILVTVLIAGGLFFLPKRGLRDSPKEREIAAATPTPAPATPPPATPVPVQEVVKAPEPDPEKPASPTPEQLIQSRIDAARIVGEVRAQMARGDFAGAARVLDEWLAGNGTHLQAAAVQAQAERLRAAAEVLPSMLSSPAALVGATIRAGNAAWTVMGVAEGRLKCQTKSQFGVVERPVEVGTLPEAALLPLLKHADASGQTALAATYLLGLGKSAEARSSIPAAAPQKDALLAGVAEWEKLARDYAVVVALDGVGTLVNRADFAAAGQRLEQSKKLYAGHDFVTTAYTTKIADWMAKIASAPPTTAAPGSRIFATRHESRCDIAAGSCAARGRPRGRAHGAPRRRHGRAAPRPAGAGGDLSAPRLSPS